MLVLTRKANETIVIGDSITVTVLQARGNTIRLGITAPRSVRVVRGELERHDQSNTDKNSTSHIDAKPASVSELEIEYQIDDADGRDNHVLPLSACRPKLTNDRKGMASLNCTMRTPTASTNRIAATVEKGKTSSPDRPLQDFLLSAKLRLSSVSAAAQ